MDHTATNQWGLVGSQQGSYPESVRGPGNPLTHSFDTRLFDYSLHAAAFLDLPSATFAGNEAPSAGHPGSYRSPAADTHVTDMLSR
jgi:hypothetical protein